MFRKYIPAAVAVALAGMIGVATSRAEDTRQVSASDSKLVIKPAVLTASADQAAPITEVQYRRYYRRGSYGSPYGYRSYGYYPYRYGYSYPYRSYSYYRPYYGGYYSYYRPYYGSYYYPRYYTGYRGTGFSYYGPRFGASFYW
jgi:hypothetical protein